MNRLREFHNYQQAWIKLQSIPVQQISVTGELEHTQREVVQEMIQPSLVGGFLGADLQSIRQQLEGLPWVYEATVRRKWPAALEIHVVEQLPIARWGEAGRCRTPENRRPARPRGRT